MTRTPERTCKLDGAARLSRLPAVFAALVLGAPAAAPRRPVPSDAGAHREARPAHARLRRLPASLRRPSPLRPSPLRPSPGGQARSQARDAKPAPVQADVPEQFKAVRAKLDAAKAELDAREKQLGHTDLTVADLTAIRDSAATETDEIRGLVTRLDAPLEAARERLTQLGPKPKDTQESAEVAEQRVEREAAVTRIDETQRLARSLVVQGDQIVDRVSNRRRESFTRDLFQRSQPLVGPGLWAKVMADVPR